MSSPKRGKTRKDLSLTVALIFYVLRLIINVLSDKETEIGKTLLLFKVWIYNNPKQTQSIDFVAFTSLVG